LLADEAFEKTRLSVQLLALRDVLHRRMSSVADGAIAEIDGPPSIAVDDADDPLRKSALVQ
jgi:hypothetical protein